MSDDATQITDTFDVPLILRGKIVEAATEQFGARQGGVAFRAPDITRYIDKLVAQAADLDDIQKLTSREIVAFMAKVGRALDLETNAYMQRAYEVSRLTSGISAPILEGMYRRMPVMFDEAAITRFIETQVGSAYLDGWVEIGRTPTAVTAIRAFGARAVHIIAGNSPGVAFATILRNAITRSDAIIKLPSNDPLTATAIAQTMIDIDPDHPVTRHLAVGYWKGGDEKVESRIYTPRNIEKIVAWGGYASIQHITRYLRPGIDLITLDPKHSASIIGQEALTDDATMRKVAARAAIDIGAYNQEACANARVIYVECDPDDDEARERLNRFGGHVFDALQELDAQLSTPSKYVVPELQEEIAGLELQDDWYRVFRKDDRSGAIIVSQTDEAVSFSNLLACRTANIVPVERLEDILKRVNAATQTIGVYPQSLKERIRDRLGLQGAQHLISLGAVTLLGISGPQDGMEPERRMLKWVKDVSIPE
ncbi:acyl-CoA reductase [Sphingomonas flavalba]|uniref:acyl-CoA reductase n=1 Tax=Sphingomonas flavalba TaxID=2559804 RepID=UPI0039DF355B